MTCVRLLLQLVVLTFAGSDSDSRGPGIEGVDYASFEISKLHCVIGNNKSVGNHHAGLNGIFAMTSPDQKETVFVPAGAGLNLEAYFGSESMRGMHAKGLFEPRSSPMTFERLSNTTAELLQPATPQFGIESRTRFELKEPYYVDVTYRCIPRKNEHKQLLGVFWASYINAPLDKSIYFKGLGFGANHRPSKVPRWMQLCAQHHDHFSTVMHVDDTGPADFKEGLVQLWNQISPLRFTEPFFYGRFRNMVLIFIFETQSGLRFAHSPNAGGSVTADGTATNPAWDFQLIVPEPRIGTEYGLKMRIVYKPWVDRQDVLREVRDYHKTAKRSANTQQDTTGGQ